MDTQEEIQLAPTVNDTFSSCLALIALARLRLEKQEEKTGGRKMDGRKEGA